MGKRTPRAERKGNIITFKTDASLSRAMRGIVNRSAFIRSAILSALDSTCPLCKGTGILTPHQHSHWTRFAVHHAVEECSDCHAVHLVCGNEPAKSGKAGGTCR
jgi:DnaJ-class molecular chaperone